MRKKVLMINLLFLLIAGTITGQDFSPGTQASGLLDGKQTMVDYSTGTFHYKIPLFELETGGYKLPVELGYTARPIRDTVPAGSLGYNWILETGGVITRIVRGGIADDNIWGFAERGLATTGTEDIRKVNLRETDGEADIFVAAYGGRKISFLLKKNSSGYYAEPLEKTMVKIRVISGGLQGVSGFKIQDEQGNLYIFEYTESTEHVYKTGSVSTNDIRDKAYVSSWYLTKIEFTNKEVIHFSYSRAGEEIFQEEIKIDYSYGRQVKNLIFDLSKYHENFKNAVLSATKAMSSLHGADLQRKVDKLNMQLERKGYSGFFYLSDIPFFVQTKLLGTAVRYDDIGKCSLELQGLISYFKNFYGTGSIVGRYLTEADYYLFKALSGGLALTDKGTSTSLTGYKINRVLLRQIRTRNHKLLFDYDSHQKYKLKQIVLYDQFMNSLQTCELSYRTDFLNRVELKGKDGCQGHLYSFSYYPEINDSRGRDYWGYRNGLSSETDHSVNANAARYGMMQTVTTPLKGTIQVDYESNQANWMLTGFVAPYGGLRIKQMITDNMFGQKDTVRYHYPYIGASVYSRTSRGDVVEYNGFSDHILKSRVENEGNAFLKTGNTGLYYEYVQEEHVGEGWNTYLFYTERGIRNGTDVFKFWLYGLPLAKAVYDRDGNLLRITKNTYFSEGAASDLQKWFRAPLSAFRYNSSLNQIRAYPYYLDAVKLDKEYKEQNSVLLYDDGGKRIVIRPYEDIYRVHIYPRLSVSLPRQNYLLKYGGCTVLAAQTEYHFSGKVSTEPSIEHLRSDLPGGAMVFADIEYIYDNPGNSLLPTRVIRKQANGDRMMDLKRTVADFTSGVSGVIRDMKQKNILVPLLQEQELYCRRGEANWTLLKEKITEYDTANPTGPVFYAPCREYWYKGDVVKVSSFPALMGNLFIGNKQNYRKSAEIDYLAYRPHRIVTPQGGFRLFYDSSPDRVQLKVNDSDEKAGYASFAKSFGSNPNIDIIRKFWDQGKNPALIFREFFIYQVILGSENKDEKLKKFMNSYVYKKFIDFIRLFSEPASTVQMSGVKDITYMENLKNLVLKTDFINDLDKHFSPDTVHVTWPQVRFSNNRLFPDDRRKLLVSELRKLKDNLTPFQMYCMTIPAPYSPENLQLKGNLPSRKYTVMVCAQPAGKTLQLSYSYKRGGTAVSGQMTDHVKCVPGILQLLCFSIDLSAESALSDLVITIPGSKAAAVVISQGVEFQATVFNKEGQVFCRFDHSGNMERYEYDRNSRVVAIYDAEGYLLNEYRYNIVY